MCSCFAQAAYEGNRVCISTIHLDQGFPTFFLPCTPSAFRQMSMYPYSISTDQDVPLQNFDRWTCTPKTPYDKIFPRDFSQIYLTIYIQWLLKTILSDICIKIWKWTIFLPSIASLKCTHSDRQMCPQGYMYPRLGTPDLDRGCTTCGLR